MDYCRSVLAVAGANFRRLKRDARVWFIFVFTALLIHYYLRPVINYAGLMDKRAKDLCGAGLKRVCELADIPPVLHMGSWLLPGPDTFQKED